MSGNVKAGYRDALVLKQFKKWTNAFTVFPDGRFEVGTFGPQKNALSGLMLATGRLANDLPSAGFYSLEALVKCREYVTEPKPRFDAPFKIIPNIAAPVLAEFEITEGDFGVGSTVGLEHGYFVGKLVPKTDYTVRWLSNSAVILESIEFGFRIYHVQHTQKTLDEYQSRGELAEFYKTHLRTDALLQGHPAAYSPKELFKN